MMKKYFLSATIAVLVLFSGVAFVSAQVESSASSLNTITYNPYTNTMYNFNSEAAKNYPGLLNAAFPQAINQFIRTKNEFYIVDLINFLKKNPVLTLAQLERLINGGKSQSYVVSMDGNKQPPFEFGHEVTTASQILVTFWEISGAEYRGPVHGRAVGETNSLQNCGMVGKNAMLETGANILVLDEKLIIELIQGDTFSASIVAGFFKALTEAFNFGGALGGTRSKTGILAVDGLHASAFYLSGLKFADEELKVKARLAKILVDREMNREMTRKLEGLQLEYATLKLQSDIAKMKAGLANIPGEAGAAKKEEEKNGVPMDQKATSVLPK